MALESSLPRVQEPSTGPCHELDESNLHPHNLSKVHVNTLRTGDSDLRFYVTTVQDG